MDFLVMVITIKGFFYFERGLLKKFLGLFLIVISTFLILFSNDFTKEIPL
jgi:hypothetical protein